MKSILLALGLLLLAIPAARAVDCAAPVSASDRVLCTDSRLEALELTLGNALKVALDNSRPPDRDVLAANQQVFIETRAIDCENDDKAEPRAPAALRQCLLDATNARIRYLLGRPLEGPGAPDPMVPQLFQGKDLSFVWAARFVDPRTAGERLFNHLVYEHLEGIHLATDENDYTDSFSLTLHYASPALISANVDMAYVGPAYAHPMPSSFAINVDLAAGRELAMADALPPARVRALQKQCEAQLAEYLSPHEEGAGQRKSIIDAMVADLRHWTFGASQAVIAYDDYALDRPLTCTIGYPELRPLLLPGFPLPE